MLDDLEILSRDPILIDFFKKSMITEFTIFNTKVLKIEGFGILEDFFEIERIQRRHT